MQVNELASALKVPPDTIRFYARKGLLNPSRNPDNDYREFGPRDTRRLRFILCARNLGFSLGDITQILGESDKGQAPCTLVRGIIEERLEEIERRFEDMARLRARMRKAAREWRSAPDGTPNGDSVCHLIENFHEEDDDDD